MAAGVGGVVSGPAQVYYKGRWMSVAARDAQKKIDDDRAAYENRPPTATPYGPATPRPPVAPGGSSAPGASGGWVPPTQRPEYAEKLRLELQAKLAAEARAKEEGYKTEAEKRAAALQADAEARRLAQLRDLMGGFGLDGGGGGDTGGSTGGNPGTLAPDPETAARDAMYARTKERIGLTSRAALDSLRNQYATSGNIGRMNEGTENVIGGAAGMLGDFEREQAIQEGGRINERGREDRAAKLARRGQNVNLIPQLMGLMTARGLY